MEKIFYGDVSLFPSSEAAVKKILKEHFKILSPSIARTENGKPYLQNTNKSLFFSVSHTKERLFIAFSKENVGVDAEPLSRVPNYPLLMKNLPSVEREEISSAKDFLKHWTAKEAAVKWFGGTLAHDLKKLSFVANRLYYDGLELPVTITVKEVDGHILSICTEKEYSFEYCTINE